MSDFPPVMYYDDVHPEARSCLMLIRMLDLDVSLHYVALFEGGLFNPDYMTLNPVHTVPTLVDKNITLTDGHAIMIYLCDTHPSEMSLRLFPRSFEKRIKVINMLFFESSIVFRCYNEFMSEIVRKTFAKTDVDYHEKKILDIYDMLESFLHENTFVAGSKITIADLSIFTTLSALDLIVPIGNDDSRWPLLFQWVEKLKTLPENRLNIVGLDRQFEIIEKLGHFQFPTNPRRGLVTNTISDVFVVSNNEFAPKENCPLPITGGNVDDATCLIKTENEQKESETQLPQIFAADISYIILEEDSMDPPPPPSSLDLLANTNDCDCELNEPPPIEKVVQLHQSEYENRQINAIIERTGDDGGQNKNIESTIETADCNCSTMISNEIISSDKGYGDELLQNIQPQAIELNPNSHPLAVADIVKKFEQTLSEDRNKTPEISHSAENSNKNNQEASAEKGESSSTEYQDKAIKENDLITMRYTRSVQTLPTDEFQLMNNLRKSATGIKSTTKKLETKVKRRGSKIAAAGSELLRDSIENEPVQDPKSLGARNRKISTATTSTITRLSSKRRAMK